MIAWSRARSTTLRDRRHRPLPFRLRRGRPDHDPLHARPRQAEGDRQGRAPDDQPAGRKPGAAGRAESGPGSRPDLRRGHPGGGHACLAPPARLAGVGRDGLVPGRAGRPVHRGAPRDRGAVRAAAARLRAARRRHGRRSSGALVRDAPGRRDGRPARGGPLRRMRPHAGVGRAVPLGPAARRRPLLALPGALGRPGRPLGRRVEAAQGLPAHGHRGDRRAAASSSRRARGRRGDARLPASLARARRPVAGLPGRGQARVVAVGRYRRSPAPRGRGVARRPIGSVSNPAPAPRPLPFRRCGSRG